MAERTEKEHPESRNYMSWENLVSNWFAGLAGEFEVMNNRRPETLAEYLRIAKGVKESGLAATNLIRKRLGGFITKEQAGRYREQDNNITRQIDEICQDLYDVFQLDEDERKKKLDYIWEGWIKGTNALRGKVPARHYPARDITGSNMMLGSSEPVFRRTTEAVERGRFTYSEEKPIPMAKADGFIGREFWGVEASLYPITPRGKQFPAEEERRFAAAMQQIQARWANTKSGVGLIAGAIMTILVEYAFKRRDASGSTTVLIDELADDLQYTRRALDRLHDRKNLKVIRDAMADLEMLRIKGEAPGKELEGRAFNFTWGLKDGKEGEKATTNWDRVTYTLGDVLKASVLRANPFLASYDKGLYALPVKHGGVARAVAIWLEREWRNNWKNGRGKVTRSVRKVLEASGAWSHEEIHTPSMKTWDKLKDALDKLEERGTLSGYLVKSPQLIDLKPKPGGKRRQRLTEGKWFDFLDSYIDFEAGPKYHKEMRRYKGDSLSDDSDGVWLRELFEDYQITQRDVAIATGLTEDVVLDIKKGSEPNYEQCLAIRRFRESWESREAERAAGQQTLI